MELPPREKGSSPHNLQALRCRERADGVVVAGETCPVCDPRELASIPVTVRELGS